MHLVIIFVIFPFVQGGCPASFVIHSAVVAEVEGRSDYSSAAAEGLHAAVIYPPFCALFLVGLLYDY